MYNQPPSQQPPQQSGMRKPASAQQQPTLNETQAKEKLMQYVYEYLVHINAPKTAEMFKTELLSNQAVQVQEPPGFLVTWFNLFWDLYSGDPERRDKCNPTQEAKAFHDLGFVHGNNQNMRPNFMGGPPMGMPSDGMMSPYFRGMPPYSTQRQPPPNHTFGPPGAPNPMMFPSSGDMRGMNQNRMRMPANYPMRPTRYGAPYMDSPTGNPPFPQFMPPDQMQPPSSMTPSTSVPTSMTMNGQIPMSESGTQPLPSLNNPLTGLLNGEDVKHSPSHHIGSVHGQNGNGTPLGPGSHHGNMVGPGSAAAGAPASVQSQPGQPGSVANPTTSSSQQPGSMALNQTQSQPNFGDHNNIMDFQSELANNNPNSHENLEIKKIREGLLDDFPNET